MSDKNIYRGYAVDAQGIITSPGKFTGLPAWSVDLWDALLSGMADDEFWTEYGELIAVFHVDPDDEIFQDVCQFFGPQTERCHIGISEDDQGFVQVFMLDESELP